METAKVIKEGKGSTYNIDEDTYSDIDLTQFSDEELIALGIDPQSVEREDLEDQETVFDNDEEDEEEDADQDESGAGDEDEDEASGSEEESTDEESSDEEEDSEDEKPAKDIRIPKARFDEAVQKERARADLLEQQLTRLLELQVTKATEQVEEVVEEADANIDELEAKYAEALILGDSDDAVKYRKQINQVQQKLINKLVKEAKSTAKDEAKSLSEEEKFQAVVETSMAEHPILNPDSEDYDEELVIEINSLAAGYKATKNLDPAKALSMAVKKLVKAPVTEDRPKPKAKPTKARKEAKAKKMAKEPPKSAASKVSDLTPDEINWEKMSDAEFDRLYEKNPALVQKYLNGTHL